MALHSDITRLKVSPIKKTIDDRLTEFRSLGKKSSREIFKELCFCILTANFSAERGIEIQKKIGDSFITLSESEMEKKLREVGYRFPRVRAKHLLANRQFATSIKKFLTSDEISTREWVVKNIVGLGYKEGSHFLRNIGYQNLAIIDFHIVDILEANHLIKRPKTMTKARYLEIEKILAGMAKKLDMNLAELDLYLWFLETGKILK